MGSSIQDKDLPQDSHHMEDINLECIHSSRTISDTWMACMGLQPNATKGICITCSMATSNKKCITSTAMLTLGLIGGLCRDNIRIRITGRGCRAQDKCSSMEYLPR